MSQISGAVTPAPNAGLERFSCLICRQRKVKCDRHNPCSHCFRAGIECSFVAPVRGKRRKTKPPAEGLHEKLMRYEELLKSHGANIDPPDNGDMSGPDKGEMSGQESVAKPDVEMADVDVPVSRCRKQRDSDSLEANRPRLVNKNGSSKYFDSGPWSSGNIGDEFIHPEEESILRERFNERKSQASTPFTDISDEHNLLLSIAPKTDSLASFHPAFPLAQAMRDVFADRVDPNLKILHLPTFWVSVTSAYQNLHAIPKSLEALMLSFYLIVVTSLDENDCISKLGEEKSVMSMRFRTAAHQALVNAEFLKTSSLMTLQAFVIFLTCMRGHCSSESIFVLSAVSVRLGRRMGLHRDGTLLNLSPFETEMRRRLWWHIVQIECRTSDFSGTKPSLDIFACDVKAPLNILDEDIAPDMASPPAERMGITPMVLTLIKCDLIKEFSRKHESKVPEGGLWDNLTRSDISLHEKSSWIDMLEDLLERKYLRYCDPLTPLDCFASLMARSAICKMKLFAYNPRQFAELGEKVPQEARDIIFKNGMKSMEYGNLAHNGEMLKKFQCQIGTSYLWDTLLYVLIEVRHRKRGPEVDRAWELIGGVFAHYPRGFVDGTDALYTALSSWTLRVWDDCVAARKADGLPEPPPPEFISGLRMRRWPEVGRELEVTADYGVGASLDVGYQNNGFEANSQDFSNLLSFDLELSEWDRWERLFGGQG